MEPTAPIAWLSPGGRRRPEPFWAAEWVQREIDAYLDQVDASKQHGTYRQVATSIASAVCLSGVEVSWNTVIRAIYERRKQRAMEGRNAPWPKNWPDRRPIRNKK